MNWTKKKPTKPGFYWIRKGGEERIAFIDESRMELHHKVTDFAGPIPKPSKKVQVSPEDHKGIIEHLNDKTGKSFKSTSQATRRLIQARINEGFSIDDCHRVIENQTKKWLTDPAMMEYLRPSTLFSPKFESYLQNGNTIPAAKSKPTNPNINLSRAYDVLERMGEDAFHSYAKQARMSRVDIEIIEFKYERESKGLNPGSLLRRIG